MVSAGPVAVGVHQQRRRAIRRNVITGTRNSLAVTSTVACTAKISPSTARTAAGISGHFILAGCAGSPEPGLEAGWKPGAGWTGTRDSEANVVARPRNRTAARGMPSQAGGRATTMASVSITPQGISAHQLERSRTYTAPKPVPMNRNSKAAAQSAAARGQSSVIRMTAARPRNTEPGMAAHQLSRLRRNRVRKTVPAAANSSGQTRAALSRIPSRSSSNRRPAASNVTPAMMLVRADCTVCLPEPGGCHAPPWISTLWLWGPPA